MRNRDPRNKVLKQVIQPRLGIPWRDNRDFLPSLYWFKNCWISTELRPRGSARKAVFWNPKYPPKV